MRKGTKAIALVGLSLFAMAGHSEQFAYNVTITWGDVSSDGLDPGTGPRIFNNLLCFNGGQVGCFSGNFDSTGDVGWTFQGDNIIVLDENTARFYDQAAGGTSLSYYDPYDEVKDGQQDYSAFGQPDCTATFLFFSYSCAINQLQGPFFPNVVNEVGPAAEATGEIVVDTVAGTLTGTLAVTAYDYSFGLGSPFGAAQDSVSDNATLTLNFQGTFTADSWTVTDGEALLSDPGLICTPGGFADVLCADSTVSGGHQSDGSHLSWTPIPVRDLADTTTDAFVLPGVVMDATLDQDGNIITSDGEFHRFLGSGGSGCPDWVVYDPAGTSITCGSVTAGIFNVTGTLIPNRTPVANDAAVVADINTPTVIDVTTIPGNSLGDAPSTVSATQPAAGATSVAGNEITYTPPADQCGIVETFDYTIEDADLETDTGTVTVTVNCLPVANDADAPSIDTVGSDPLGLTSVIDISTIMGNDLGDQPSVVTSTAPPLSLGTVTVDGTVITYTLRAGSFTGTDSFVYTITDATGDLAAGRITVDIPNAQPTASNLSARTRPEEAIAIDVVDRGAVTPGNGSVDQHVFEVTVPPENGTAEFGSPVVTYTPDPDFKGTDTFQYTVTDGDGEVSAPATITVRVGAEVAKLPGGSSMDILSLLGLSGLLGLVYRRRRFQFSP